MKLGILGGTFDPIHHGHLAAALAARRAAGLDRVLFVPSHLPPHRGRAPLASGFHRFAMVALAVRAEPALEVSDVELTRPGLSFSVDTIRALHAQGWQPVQLFFITGVDAFAEIRTWKAFPDILDDCHFAVVTRPGYDLDTLKARLPDVTPRFVDALDSVAHAGALNGPGTRVLVVEAATADISSTTIRGRIGASEDIRGLVPDDVKDYLHKHRLYTHPSSGIAIA